MSPILRDSLLTMVFNVVGKGAGLIIPFFIAAWFGVGSKTDAFFMSYSLILAFSEFLGPSLQNVIVPFIIEKKRSPDELGRFLGGIAAWGTSAAALLLGLFLLLLSWGLPLAVPRRSGTTGLIFSLLLETALLAVFSLWSGLLSGILNAFKRFALPAISPVFRAGTALGFIFAFKGRLGIHALALGYVLGETCRTGLLAAQLVRLRIVSWNISFRPNRELPEFFKIAAFQTAGLAFLSLNLVIDKFMAAWLGQGQASILHYAERLYLIPLLFILGGIFVPLVSYWSESFYASGIPRLRSDIRKALLRIGGATAAFVVPAFVFHRRIVEAAFLRGALAAPLIPEIDGVFVFFLLGLLPQVLGSIFLRAHLIIKNTRRVMLCTGTMLVLKIGMNLLFMKTFSLPGIALATALNQVFFLACLGTSFYKKLNDLEHPSGLGGAKP